MGVATFRNYWHKIKPLSFLSFISVKCVRFFNLSRVLQHPLFFYQSFFVRLLLWFENPQPHFFCPLFLHPITILTATFFFFTLDFLAFFLFFTLFLIRRFSVTMWRLGCLFLTKLTNPSADYHVYLILLSYEYTYGCFVHFLETTLLFGYKSDLMFYTFFVAGCFALLFVIYTSKNPFNSFLDTSFVGSYLICICSFFSLTSSLWFAVPFILCLCFIYFFYTKNTFFSFVKITDCFFILFYILGSFSLAYFFILSLFFKTVYPLFFFALALFLFLFLWLYNIVFITN